MKSIRIFLLLFIALIAHQSLADWRRPGIAYICNQKSNLFIMQSTMDSESAPVVSPRSGYTQINETSKIICNLANVKISTAVTIRPPYPTGICGGLQQVYLDNFYLNDHKLFEYSMFNDTCSGDPVLYEIRVRPQGSSAKVELCHTTWDWEAGYGEPTCKNL